MNFRNETERKSHMDNDGRPAATTDDQVEQSKIYQDALLALISGWLYDAVSLTFRRQTFPEIAFLPFRTGATTKRLPITTKQAIDPKVT